MAKSNRDSSEELEPNAASSGGEQVELPLERVVVSDITGHTAIVRDVPQRLHKRRAPATPESTARLRSSMEAHKQARLELLMRIGPGVQGGQEGLEEQG